MTIDSTVAEVSPGPGGANGEFGSAEADVGRSGRELSGELAKEGGGGLDGRRTGQLGLARPATGDDDTVPLIEIDDAGQEADKLLRGRSSENSHGMGLVWSQEGRVPPLACPGVRVQVLARPR